MMVGAVVRAIGRWCRTAAVWPRALGLLGFLLPALAGAAEVNYVIDKLLVGVHEERNLDSAIIKVLPTGTRLTVIERDGELALVEDPQKIRGWVDAAYLTEERPAQLLLGELRQENANLERQLEALKDGAARPSAPAGNDGGGGQVDDLMKENTDLKARLSEQRLRAGELNAEVARLRSQVQNNNAPPDARIVELERETERLEAELKDAHNTAEEFEARASMTPSGQLAWVVFKEYALRVLFGIVLGGLVFFGGGYWLNDYLSRRRHGGFRI